MTRLAKVLVVGLTVLVLGGCTPQGVEPAVESRTSALEAGVDPGNLDILFMIDNSSSMTELQMKMLNQDPGFMTVLQNLTNGLPNVHVAVVSSDMGAPGDAVGSIGCTVAGDDGVFQFAPQGTCPATTLTGGATFISNVGGVANYTGTLEGTFGCIAQLGDKGCGFEHQLSAVARALGADGAPPPSQNVGFLRNNAVLAIVFLTNEDDCSAPTNTQLFSLNVGGSNQQNIANALGPIANYRCNQWGHLCNDPASAAPTAFISPPLNPPSDAQGIATAPTLNLTNCESNDTGAGLLTPVSTLVAGIRALKSDPDNQIVVGAISPPVVPYTVAWVSPGNLPNTQPGELWPQIEHSCGAVNGDDVNPLATQHPTDGSFGDPGVRVAQFVRAFGSNGIVTSICDPDYGAAFQLIADRIDAHLHDTTTTGAAGSGGGGSSGAAGVGGAGAAGTSGSGAAGTTGSGTAGTTGSGTAGTSGSGAAGTTGTGVAGAGGHGTAGTTGSGVAGTTGSGTAGTSGTGVAGAGGHGTAGTTGSGTGGTTGTGVAGAGGHDAAGGGGSTTSGAAGTGPAAGGAGGASSSGGGGQVGASGAPGAAGTSGATGAAGTSGGGHPGGAAGTGGTTTTGSGSSGCGCDTGASGPSGFALALLLGVLATLARRARRPTLTARASRRSRR